MQDFANNFSFGFSCFIQISSCEDLFNCDGTVIAHSRLTIKSESARSEPNERRSKLFHFDEYNIRSSHRDSFRKYLFFFSRSHLFKIFQEGPFVPRTDMNFPEGSICSSNRHEFSRRVYMFFEQTRIFQEGLSKRHVFSRRFYLFVEQTLLSHQTDTNFHRNPYLVLEHIRIFQEPLFSHRTDTHFPGSPI